MIGPMPVHALEVHQAKMGRIDPCKWPQSSKWPGCTIYQIFDRRFSGSTIRTQHTQCHVATCTLLPLDAFEMMVTVNALLILRWVHGTVLMVMTNLLHELDDGLQAFVTPLRQDKPRMGCILG